MGKRNAASDNSNETRLLARIRARSEEIDRRLDENGARRIACPRCGASFLSGKGAKRSTCPCCGESLDLKRLVADAAMPAAGLTGSYDALLCQGTRDLREQKWDDARDVFATACAVDPENGDAWYGLISAWTRRMTKMESPQPDELAAVAMRTLDGRGAEFEKLWTRYKRDCASYFETQARIERERREAEKQARRDAEEEKKRAARERKEKRREARNDPDRKAARRNLVGGVLSFVGIALFIIFALLGLGGVAIGVLVVANLFGGNNRGRRR